MSAHTPPDGCRGADGMMAAMPELSRRALLRLGVGTAAGAAALRLSPPASAAPTYVDGSFVSAARGGVATNWAIARPPGQNGALRPIIALHGKGQNAAGVMAGGVEQGLAQAVAAGIHPLRWSPSTAAAAIGTNARPGRTPAPWC